GLFRDDSQRISNKVPGLSSLPFIGKLFSDKNNDRRKNEIVLLITPRILHNIAPANAVYTLFPSGVNSGGGSSRNVRQAETNTPVPQTVSVQTPQALQAERAQIDQGFSNQLLQPDAEANGTSAKTNP
ncbi:MAG: type II and III secretion system protein, partial [Methylophilales bacterium]|nr:type II and III secretion system protein [Methylophilales bacterium]